MVLKVIKVVIKFPIFLFLSLLLSPLSFLNLWKTLNPQLNAIVNQ
jgi:hypothetical protein